MHHGDDLAASLATVGITEVVFRALAVEWSAGRMDRLRVVALDERLEGKRVRPKPWRASKQPKPDNGDLDFDAVVGPPQKQTSAGGSATSMSALPGDLLLAACCLLLTADCCQLPAACCMPGDAASGEGAASALLALGDVASGAAALDVAPVDCMADGVVLAGQPEEYDP